MTDTTEKAKAGRPKGRGRVPGSGRKKGTPNRSTAQTRERILELSDPIAFMADVMKGKRMVAAGEPGDSTKTWVYPTLEQRHRAGEVLMKRLIPELKSQEITGDLRPMFTHITRTIVEPMAPGKESETPVVDDGAVNGKTPPAPSPVPVHPLAVHEG